MQSAENDRVLDFRLLLKEARRLTAQIDIPDTTIMEIFRAKSDWEFVLKIDALLETATKFVVKASFQGCKSMDQRKLETFLEALPMRGRTSLLTLLDAAGCPDELIDLIDGVRVLRNAFAHDIVQVGRQLIEVIMARRDRSSLLRKVGFVDEYDEQKLTAEFMQDGQYLRFCILSGTLTFLVLAFHNAFREPGETDRADEPD